MTMTTTTTTRWEAATTVAQRHAHDLGPDGRTVCRRYRNQDVFALDAPVLPEVRTTLHPCWDCLQTR
jgi:hypothetical protein